MTTTFGNSASSTLGQPDVPVAAGGSVLADAIRLQSAVTILGKRSRETADAPAFLHEAASLVADSLGMEAFGWGEVTADKKSLQLRISDTNSSVDGPGKGREFELTASLNDLNNLHIRSLRSAQPLMFPQGKEVRADAWLQARGIRSGLICPIFDADQRGGMFGVYSREERAMRGEDLLLGVAIAQLAASTVGRIRAERALDDERRRAQSVFETMPALMIVLKPDGRIEKLNRTAQLVTGFSLAEIGKRPLWGVFLLPEEVTYVRQALDRARLGEAEIPCECYVLTKHGQRRRVAWNFATIKNEHGQVESIVGSGLDITEKCEALHRLELAERTADEVRQSISDLHGSISTGRRELSAPAFPAGMTPDILTEGLGNSGVKDSERRAHGRRAYPYLQAVAPVNGEQMPDRRMFREVRCRDISRQGFSFLSPVKPEPKHIVVAFGSPPNLLYLLAEIVHVSPTEFNSVRVFHVGCRYVRRVEIR